MCVQLCSDLCTTPLLYHTHTFQVDYVSTLGSTPILIVIVGRKPEVIFSNKHEIIPHVYSSTDKGYVLCCYV